MREQEIGELQEYYQAGVDQCGEEEYHKAVELCIELLKEKQRNKELEDERDCKSGDSSKCLCYEKKGFPCYRHLEIDKVESCQRTEKLVAFIDGIATGYYTSDEILEIAQQI